MGNTPSTPDSSLGSRVRNSKEPLPPSRKDLASLQVWLDRDFQDFWEVRRFGANFGLRIRCSCCGMDAPSRGANEDIVWYGYRKWRWLATHLVSTHCRAQANTYQHRRAIKEDRAKIKETKFAGKRTATA